MEYPDRRRELRIIKSHMPDIGEELARQVVEFVHGMRDLDLQKKPGIAETLDWVTALIRMNSRNLDDDVDSIANTMLCLLKTKEDRDAVTVETVHKLVAQAV